MFVDNNVIVNYVRCRYFVVKIVGIYIVKVFNLVDSY